MSTLPITAVEPGCYVPREHKIDALGEVCDLAVEGGWEPDASYEGARGSYYASFGRVDDGGFLEYVDEAEEWLNSNTEGPGYWEWYDGDFGYYVDEDDA
jgi:hypothetical protein